MGPQHSFTPRGALHLLSNFVLFGSLLSGAAAQDDSTRLRDCLTNTSILASLATFSDASNWQTVTSPWALRFNPEPAAVVVPRSREEVVAAVACAVEAGVKVSPLNGGHSYGAYGLGGVDGALVINMERFTDTTFDEATGLFTYVSSRSELIHNVLTAIAMVLVTASARLQRGCGKTTNVTFPTSEQTGLAFVVLRSVAGLAQPVAFSAHPWITWTALR
jgi:hypothetical protein